MAQLRERREAALRVRRAPLTKAVEAVEEQCAQLRVTRGHWRGCAHEQHYYVLRSTSMKLGLLISRQCSQVSLDTSIPRIGGHEFGG